ncbi:hypothetical protein C0L86_16600 [Streptomyces sp. SCA2-2]|nr:hypothetical protein C0L86_16600 [Streptomyces sp. SCA2-2]
MLGAAGLGAAGPGAAGPGAAGPGAAGLGAGSRASSPCGIPPSLPCVCSAVGQSAQGVPGAKGCPVRQVARNWPGLCAARAGHGLASRAGRAVGCCPSWPCRSQMASNAGRAIGVRGSSGAWVGRGRAGVPPHKLHGAG